MRSLASPTESGAADTTAHCWSQDTAHAQRSTSSAHHTRSTSKRRKHGVETAPLQHDDAAASSLMELSTSAHSSPVKQARPSGKTPQKATRKVSTLTCMCLICVYCT